jgi:hypothetical protein
MAYLLRTSPEGLKYTAASRGEAWPDDVDLGEAEAELRVRLLADDRVRLVPQNAMVVVDAALELEPESELKP